jgi:hypothetical protein
MNKLLSIIAIILVICVFEISAQYGWQNNQGQPGSFPNFPNNFPTPFPINPQSGQNVQTRFVEETASDNNGQKTHTRRVCDNSGCREVSSYGTASSVSYSYLLLVLAYVFSRFI